MSQDVQPPLSLLSLSIAAANALPMPPATPVADPSRSSQGPPATKHRRLSSAGRSRRRLSDARDAATRPFPSALQTASASFAALSLSSPTVSHRPVNGTQPIQVSLGTSSRGASRSIEDSLSPPHSHTPLSSGSVNGTKLARKRGAVFTCESCSKVYRHPSCLIKHRWEHTPQWHEASKFVLSKHQQVQLLEAAAILSHLSPSSASLPEDRSLWPSFLSGGLVPLPGSVPSNGDTAATSHMSSSVPASSIITRRTSSTSSPRLHDYAIERSSGGVTQVRPGVVGVPMDASQQAEDDALNLLALHSPRTHRHSHSLSHHPKSASTSLTARERARRRSNAYEYGLTSGSGYGSSLSASGLGREYAPDYAYASHAHGGWALPRSSVRSKSGSSRSRSDTRSTSDSRSDDEHGYGEYEDEGEGDDGERYGSGDEHLLRRAYHIGDSPPVRRVEQWDGKEMEMEMEMD